MNDKFPDLVNKITVQRIRPALAPVDICPFNATGVIIYIPYRSNQRLFNPLQRGFGRYKIRRNIVQAFFGLISKGICYYKHSGSSHFYRHKARMRAHH